MIKRQSWQEVKKWEEWLEENMTEEHVAKMRRNIQRAIAEGLTRNPTHWLSVTSGSNLDWASSGSPVPIDGKIPEMDKVTRIRCWYCGGANRIEELRCIHCGAPLLEE